MSIGKNIVVIFSQMIYYYESKKIEVTLIKWFKGMYTQELPSFWTSHLKYSTPRTYSKKYLHENIFLWLSKNLINFIY